jgi:hypothetical protein
VRRPASARQSRTCSNPAACCASGITSHRLIVRLINSIAKSVRFRTQLIGGVNHGKAIVVQVPGAPLPSPEQMVKADSADNSFPSGGRACPKDRGHGGIAPDAIRVPPGGCEGRFRVALANTQATRGEHKIPNLVLIRSGELSRRFLRVSSQQISTRKAAASEASSSNHYFAGGLLRASLHFPSFRYMNSPQLRCPGADSARYAALRWIEVGRSLAAPRALVGRDLADA